MIRPVVNRSLTLALAVLMWGGSGALLHGQALMQEPLGKTSEPKMTLFVTTLPPGYEAPMHQHGGVVFIYVLEGEIESQVEPNPPKIYHAGDFFHEPPMQVHRTFRNLSKTAPAKFLNFSNIATQNTGTPPLHIHRSYRNLSGTNPAELLVFEVREKGQPLAVAPK